MPLAQAASGARDGKRDRHVIENGIPA